MIDLDSRHPFAPDNWGSAEQHAAHLFWDWYYHVFGLAEQAALAGAPSEIDWTLEKARLAAGEPSETLAASPLPAVLDICASHGIPQEWPLAALDYMNAARLHIRLKTWGEMDGLLQRWPLGHGRMLSALAGLTRRRQIPAIDEMSRAHFLADRLINLRHWSEEKLLMIPEDEFGSSGLGRARFSSGEIDENMRRVLWKQLVRVRDRASRTTLLYDELPSRFKRPFRRWWMSLLWTVDEVERRDYQLWERDLEPSRIQRFTIALQTLFARRAFRRR